MRDGGAPASGLAIDLYGNGRVARALLPLLGGSGLRLASIHDRSGPRRQFSVTGRRVLVDATSPRYEGDEAEAWVRTLEQALAEGTPVVTCNKAPLAVAWKRLAAAARSGGTTVSCAATVGAGTPVLLLLDRLHRSRGVARVDGSLTATLGYVCDRVVQGATIACALDEARRSGIAEPDPALDLDGTDSLAKSVIIHNLLFRDRSAQVLRARRPRLDLSEERIRATGNASEPPRVVSTVAPGGIDLALGSSPLLGVRSGGSALASVRVTLDDGSETALVGPGAGPEATAGALLADLLDLRHPVDRWPEGIVP